MWMSVEIYGYDVYQFSMKMYLILCEILINILVKKNIGFIFIYVRKNVLHFT